MKTFILPTLFALILLLQATTTHSQSPAFITPQFITGQPGCHDYWPGFTADGNSVLFSRRSGAGKWAIYRKIVGGDDAFPFLPGFIVESTRVSVAKDGRVAFTGAGNALYVADSSGAGPQRIKITNLRAGAVYPSWMPEDTAVVVVSYQRKDTISLGGVLARINLEKGSAVLLTTLQEVRAGMADVSPDGKRIVISAIQPGHPSGTRIALLALPAAFGKTPAP